MCGLVGFIGQPSKINRQIFQDMLCLDVRRGPHSTGMAAASAKGAYVLKSTGLPWDLISTPAFQSEVREKNWPVMMGHNRFATMGLVTEENAHPFWHDHIILTHNGTLTGLHRLDKNIDFDTDSEVFAYNVATKGIKDTYRLTSGAMTCVWWDQKLKNLNAITNGQRPFNFVLTEDKRTLFYASEDWMFRLACEARNVKLSKDFFTLKEDHHYSFFQTRKGTIDYTCTELSPFQVEFKGSTYDSKTGAMSSMGYGHGWNDDDDDWAEYVGANYDAVAASNKNSSPGFDLKPTSYRKKPKGKDHFTADDRQYGLVKDVIPNEQTYIQRFGTTPCVICGGEMEKEHKTALLIDCETIACHDCTDLCKKHEIDLT